MSKGDRIIGDLKKLLEENENNNQNGNSHSYCYGWLEGGVKLIINRYGKDGG